MMIITLFLRRCEHSLNKEPTTKQNTDTTIVQLGEPMSFTGVTYRNMVRCYRSRKDSKTPVSPKPTKHGHSSCKLETWSTLHTHQAAHQIPKYSFYVAQVALSLFSTSWLVSASSRQLSLPKPTWRFNLRGNNYVTEQKRHFKK